MFTPAQLPLFIKLDDVGYGLRAAEHGYGTVTLPGCAIWHMAWSDKDDAIDWQAYFHLRNRLVVACRIIVLEDQLAQAHAVNAALRGDVTVAPIGPDQSSP